ncbi:hypothetical protein [Bifidobacterium tibiigranuli]|jgi:hypothetical protein|uniref:hypothetical protein n=1 Tax=Bifidobacterium tibiigranuli TaxID=2172043 RepID=UPI00192A17F8|nr:hypothetical protein [Bifidobacterium tibiigranuli]
MNDYTDFPALLEERYSEKISFTLIRDDAEEFYESHPLEECYAMGLALYESGNYQVQEAACICWDIAQPRTTMRCSSSETQ